MPIRYRYIGNTTAQEHHEGIPARNLSAEEFDALSREQQRTVRDSPIYREVKHDQPKEEAKQEDAPAKEEPKKDTKK